MPGMVTPMFKFVLNVVTAAAVPVLLHRTGSNFKHFHFKRFILLVLRSRALLLRTLLNHLDPVGFYRRGS